ncbi:MAG: glycosyltransferase [Minisyncoccia bacterium]
MQKKFLSAAQNAAFIFFLYVPTALVFYLTFTTEYIPVETFTTTRLIVFLLFAPILLKYVVHLLIAPLYPLVERGKWKKNISTYTPSVSVLIPAWNEEVGIVSTIRSILNIRYPKLEIIIVNDGSTDNTHKVVNDFIENYQLTHDDKTASIIYRVVPNGGKARALNTVLPIAQGEILVTIDADSAMEPSALKNLVKHFIDPKVASVAGNVVVGNRKKPIGLLQQLEYLYGFYFKRADSLFNAVYIVGGAAAAYRRELIVELGGYDTNSITEDIELSTRLQDNGHKVRYAADAIVYTEGPSDFSGLCRQRLRWKYGRLLTFHKYRHLFFSLDSKHNPYLSFFILPLALFAEFLLFFEGILLIIFYLYTFYSNDYLPLAFVICLLTVVVGIQIISDPNMRYHKNLFWIAPGAWVLFYFMDFVEYRALIGSIRHIVTKRDLSWQNWTRLGVFEND